ncbi:S-formylglutathione hydrolase-like [Uloborus diversus]|uniref:S-formylglutathione hydrolase-like n=1 Tax=Uloborus diversus TaxID=327109 RepID=UPI002409672F|nr:S-formylglutathione hydrolase-like [Uloborus diversus]
MRFASTMSEVTEVSSSKCFDGYQKVFRHSSSELKCDMKFSVYLPNGTQSGKTYPVLYWLSGLTCTEENFIIKSGFQQYASKHEIIVVGPDTSPRGCKIEGEDEDYDFGTGAGFYVDATEPKWKNNYRMYSYVTKELPAVIEKSFPTNGKVSIMGHSMGGHGALICAIKNPGMFLSVSAFAPISNPIDSPWGQKAFTGYLGSNQNLWKDYDATELAKEYAGPSLDILIDQGTEDQFLEKQLKPEHFTAACKGTKIKPDLKMRHGYDHSFYFISTYLREHFEYHAKKLC